MTLAILSALAEEQHSLRARLQDAERVQRAGREFWRGRWQGHEVVLALSRVGKVAAATTATALIEGLGVRRIVFSGVAGGVEPGVRVGDVVVADAFVQHDLDASPLFPRFEIPLYGCDRMVCDAALTATLFEATNQAMAEPAGRFEGLGLPDDPAVHRGLVASGDRFVSAAAESQVLRERLLQAGHRPLAVEMEGAAVAQVCFDYGVPFAAVRTVSDRADEHAHRDFTRFVQAVASPRAEAILDRFLGLLSRS
ncbi:MAG: 5'-methylthioadenosine/adenosylhomocysteine nucleosidase [Rhodoferax sp.]|nr:5'-methylthioadenosine/adenosylhomocysteine nucleosidase [Rhodoferax sp.]